ncbi:MAG TPA: gamma-glutamylcyclotransferase [Acidimicrobiales bacterium]|nr:gamma-glutamylcyclotransferase [Acidimicrobiales bacterium]
MVAVFVYGTLMPGGPLWPALRPYAMSEAPATAAGRLWDTGLGYPAARFEVVEGGPGAGVVPGVLVAIASDRAPQALAMLDEIEEEGVLYRRVELATSRGPAVAYEWLGPTAGLVELADGWPRTG